MLKKFFYSIIVLLTLSSQSVFAVDKCGCEEVTERWCCRELEFVYKGCPINHTFCMGVFNGIMHVKVDDFTIPAACVGQFSYIDLQLEAIAYTYKNYNIFPSDEPNPMPSPSYPGETCWDSLPTCPDVACNYVVEQAVCLKSYLNEKDNTYTFIVCDDGQYRKCYSMIRYCYDPELDKVVFSRFGFPVGPPCPEGCINACE